MITRLYRILLNGWTIGYNLNDLANYLKFLFSARSCCADVNLVNTFTYQYVVISLPFRIDRRNFITEQFNKLGITFRFLDAIHGRSQKSLVVNTGFINLNLLRYLSNGSLGCIASHIKAWRELLKSGQDFYLIFEDDVVLNKTEPEITILLKQLPEDFEIAYLGHGSIDSRLNVKKISASLGRPFSIRKGAYGYCISKKGAANILKQIAQINIVNGGLDTILGILLMRKKINGYVFLPSLCTVEPNFTSNIRNLSVQSKRLHYTEFHEWSSYHQIFD